jgi:ABC-type antimicrobial peptide transport system permease subunit
MDLPRLPLRFFRWYCHPKLRDYIEGDLVEMYGRRVKVLGKRKADIRFIIDVLLLLRPGIIRPAEGYKNLNTYGMYKSYFKIAWRNLKKNKGYSSINIIGLAVGMTVAILIGLWIRDELSFDSYFKNRDRLAQVMLNQTNEGITYTGGSIQMPLGDALRTGYTTDFKAVSLTSWNSDYVLSTGDRKLAGKGMWVQYDFPDMFTFNMLSGRSDVLKDPSSILICSSLAKALFGNDDPVNKPIRIDNRVDMIVGGVFEDLPHNTTFHETQLLLPWENKENWLNKRTDWMDHNGQLFVLLSDEADLHMVSEKIRSVPTPHIQKWKEEIMLHPMSQLHLYNEFENGKVSGGRVQFVWLFGIIGVFVLLLACINFMNLSTARSEKRAKEVGIRKTIGSVRSQLVGQFLSESVVVATLAFIMSLILVEIALPYFSALADKKMVVSWGDPVFWLLILGFTLFTGLVSGSYPAFYLSAFKPVKILKGSFSAGRLATLPRKVLVVVQFTVSITLIIGTLIVFRQIQHAKNRTTGFTRDGLITAGINTPELRKNIDVIKNELLQKGVIENLALSSQSPAHFGNNNGIDWKGKDPALVVFFRNVGVTPDFGKTIGWSVKKGRDFSVDLPGDSAAVIINENAVKIMGFEDPLGEIIKYRGKEYTIIGVTEDMLTQSPYDPSQPTFFITDDWVGLIVMRLNATMPVREALAEIESVFKKYNPESPFDFSFVDQDFARKYSSEERIGNLAGLFAILAVFISCLGLFGLASFVAEQRTKEIGIRKVLGATVASLWKMLSKDFVVLTVISCCISIPLTLAFMRNWLMQYQYRTTLSWEVFATAALGAVALTLLTVSFQAVKAALMNPVKSLRTE